MFQDTPHYCLVLSEGLRVDQNVIKVDAYQAFHDVSENVIHHSLEGCQAIGEAEEHHRGLEQPSVGSEGSLPLIAPSDPDIIVPPPNIQLGEVLRPLELVYEFRNERNWVSVLDSHHV